MKWTKILRAFFALVFVFTLVLPASAASTGKLAVTPKGWDDMGQILKSLGDSPTEVTYDQLSDINQLKQYDAIYINCSGDAEGQAKTIAPTIKQYVEDGGILYASDFAAAIIAEAFPGKINLYNGTPGGVGGDYYAAHVGQTGDVNAKVVDSGLAAVLGKSLVKINFDLGSWVVIDSPGAGTRVLMSGDVPVTAVSENSSNSTLSNKPLVLTFSQGKGDVLYTSFHNEAQLSKDVEAIVKWFGIRTKAGKLLSATRELAVKKNQISLQEVVDTINKGETKTYTFNATGEADFSLTLNFGGSTLAMTVKDPSGNVVDSKDVSSPPYTKQVSAKKGQYTISIEAKDVSEANYPFVLLASGPRKAAADEIVVGQATASSSPAETLSAFQKILNGIMLAGKIIAGVIILAIIILIMTLVAKSRKKSKQPAVEKKE